MFRKGLDDDNCDSRKSLGLKLNPDGEFHTYHLELRSSPGYRGLVTGNGGAANSELRFPGKSLSLRA